MKKIISIVLSCMTVMVFANINQANGEEVTVIQRCSTVGDCVYTANSYPKPTPNLLSNIPNCVAYWIIDDNAYSWERDIDGQYTGNIYDPVVNSVDVPLGTYGVFQARFYVWSYHGDSSDLSRENPRTQTRFTCEFYDGHRETEYFNSFYQSETIFIRKEDGINNYFTHIDSTAKNFIQPSGALCTAEVYDSNGKVSTCSALLTVRGTTPTPTPPPIIPAPILNLYANPNTINLGQETKLTWIVSGDATSCIASGDSDWTGAKSYANGMYNQYVTPSTIGTKTYQLTCSNAGGIVTSSYDVLVNPAPTCGTSAREYSFETEWPAGSTFCSEGTYLEWYAGDPIFPTLEAPETTWKCNEFRTVIPVCLAALIYRGICLSTPIYCSMADYYYNQCDIASGIEKIDCSATKTASPTPTTPVPICTGALPSSNMELCDKVNGTSGLTANTPNTFMFSCLASSTDKCRYTCKGL